MFHEEEGQVNNRHDIYCGRILLSLKLNFTFLGPLLLRTHLHLHCLSIRVRAPDKILFALRPRLGSEVIWAHGHFYLQGRRAVVGMRIAQPGTSESEEIATCSDGLRHSRLCLSTRTQTRTSVNTKHQFSCFDCVRAWTRILGPGSRM